MTWELDDYEDGVPFCQDCGREIEECVCDIAEELEFGDTILEDIVDEVWDPSWGVNPDDDLPNNVPGD